MHTVQLLLRTVIVRSLPFIEHNCCVHKLILTLLRFIISVHTLWVMHDNIEKLLWKQK